MRTDFLRIGSVKRMDRAVLPFSLHCESSKSSSVVGELKEMLKTAASPAEAAIIECVLCCSQHTYVIAFIRICQACWWWGCCSPLPPQPCRRFGWQILSVNSIRAAERHKTTLSLPLS